MGNLLGLLIGHDAVLSVFQILCDGLWVAMFCFDGISGWACWAIEWAQMPFRVCYHVILSTVNVLFLLISLLALSCWKLLICWD